MGVVSEQVSRAGFPEAEGPSAPPTHLPQANPGSTARPGITRDRCCAPSWSAKAQRSRQIVLMKSDSEVLSELCGCLSRPAGVFLSLEVMVELPGGVRLLHPPNLLLLSCSRTKRMAPVARCDVLRGSAANAQALSPRTSREEARCPRPPGQGSACARDAMQPRAARVLGPAALPSEADPSRRPRQSQLGQAAHLLVLCRQLNGRTSCHLRRPPRTLSEHLFVVCSF